MNGSLALVGSGEYLPAMSAFEKSLLDDGVANGVVIHQPLECLTHFRLGQNRMLLIQAEISDITLGRGRGNRAVELSALSRGDADGRRAGGRQPRAGRGAGGGAAGQLRHQAVEDHCACNSQYGSCSVAFNSARHLCFSGVHDYCGGR
mgnify:CR=1 FL=1